MWGQGTGWYRSRGSQQQLLRSSVSPRDFCPVPVVQGSTPVTLQCCCRVIVIVFFWKGPGRQYFRLCVPYYLSTTAEHWYLSEWVTLLTKVHLVRAMVFPVVMYGYESWTIKKAEHQRIGAFELWCWRRLLRVPWNARRANQSVLKEISPEYSLEGLMLLLKLKLQLQLMGTWWEDLTHWKNFDAGKNWRQEEKGTREDKGAEWQHRLYGHEFVQAPEFGDRQGSLACCSL